MSGSFPDSSICAGDRRMSAFQLQDERNFDTDGNVSSLSMGLSWRNR